MAVPEIEIDLSRPPEERWALLRPYVTGAKQLLDIYLADLGGLSQFSGLVEEYRDACIRAEYIAELAALAEMAGVTEEEALIGNLYYDALKFVVGCTAFAIDTPDGPIHARNLDWWTRNGMLSRYTLIANFRHGHATCLFRPVGWPGFIGTLSGMAPGRFSITLNAALSYAPPAFASPVPLVLRAVFEKAGSFREAVDTLQSIEMASDCLLLVTGTRPGEMVVIERTPTQASLRYPEDGFIVVANDYRVLDVTETVATDQELQVTSCGRFDRAFALLRESKPLDADDCWRILNDPQIKMGLTVQQMVMSASLGLLEVRLPD